MKIKNQRGYTLIEIMAASVISVVLVFLITTMVFKALKILNEANRKMSLSSDQILIQKKITQTLSISDIKIYSLNGNNTLESAFSRFLIPMPGHCANLTTDGNCSEGTALVYANLARDYKKVTMAYCWIEKTKQILVSSEISELVKSTAEISLVGLISPPASTMWMVDSIENVEVDSKTYLPKVPKECLEFFDLDKDKRHISGNRKILKVSSFFSQSKGAAVDESVKMKMSLNLPMILQKIEIFSMGLAVSPQNVMAMDFVVLPCSLDGASVLRCIESPLFSIEKIKANRIIEYFKFNFPSDEDVTHYQITGEKMAATNSCTLPTCKSMLVKDPLNIPYTLSGETFDNIQSSQFSTIKQELLRRIDVLIVDSNSKEHRMTIPLE